VEGKSYEWIIAWLLGEGVPVSRPALQRWAKRNGVEKVAAWDSPERRAEQLRRVEAAQQGDDVEVLRARVEHLEAELQSADAVLKRLRKAANRDVAIGQIVEYTVENHFTGTRNTLAPYVAQADKVGTPQEFLAHVSDLHYGEVVDPDLAMGIEYSPEVARRRMSYLRDKIIRYADLRPYEISHLHVAVLGDMTSGNNHEDLDTTNARGMVDQALDVAELLYGMAADFADHFPRVSFTVMTGNHGRIHKIPRHKARYENWDYVAGRALETMVRMGLDDRTTVVVPRGSQHIISVAGHKVALTHGDGVKAASFAGIPFYGLKQRRDALQAMLRSLNLPPVDQVSLAHFHVPIWWPGECNVLINGSIKGADEYVMDTRHAATPPVQLLQEWHHKFGVTSVNHIDLEHV
jgi:hypothetical protein